jgi:hypothetical protein
MFMWLYNGKEIGDDEIEGYASFVYMITNLETGKKYIGKKILKSFRRKKVKGKTRRKKVETESDWRKYFGSSGALQEDIERLGQDRFKREILRLCKTRGTASYWEAYEIMVNNAIISDDFYNESLQCRVHRSHVKD